MGELKVKEKEIVVPGDIVAIGMDFIPGFGTYRRDEKIVAERLGLVSVEKKVIRIIPLSGSYFPKIDDVIVGKIIDITPRGWKLEINSPYYALLSLREATHEYIKPGTNFAKILDLGDLVAVKVINIASNMFAEVTMKGQGLRKLAGGRFIKINPSKVPRVIGKKASMLMLLKNTLHIQMVVGVNGIIWIKGHPIDEIIAIRAIKKIEEEAHLPGLTERMAKYLTKWVKEFEKIKKEFKEEEFKDSKYKKIKKTLETKKQEKDNNNKNKSTERKTQEIRQRKKGSKTK